jgi:hypothetical protein
VVPSKYLLIVSYILKPFFKNKNYENKEPSCGLVPFLILAQISSYIQQIRQGVKFSNIPQLPMIIRLLS